MRRSNFLIAAAILACTAGAALAADVTGKWVGQMGGPDGDGPSMTFNFKQDGTKLTGSVDGPGGEPLEIKDGKVEGDKIIFTLSFEGPDRKMKITHEGTIKSNDEITLGMKMEGG
ncbi:MAG TPA: hypothetical protein PLZ95_05405, partial [Bryobacteraceae bacterium]|nr:hypothetical protein [Bryobacteraceae bacterium]